MSTIERDETAGARRDYDVIVVGSGFGAAFSALPLVHAGARVLMPKTALPGEQGYIAHVADPDGNRIGLHAMS